MPLLLSLLFYGSVIFYKIRTHWLYYFFGDALYLKLAEEIALHPQLYVVELIVLGCGIVALAMAISIVKKHIKVRVI